MGSRDVAALLHSLTTTPEQGGNEIVIINQFLDNINETITSDLRDKGLPEKITDLLVTNRICNLSWIGSNPSRKWTFCLLKLGRIIFREKSCVKRFHIIGGQAAFVQFYHYLTRCFIAHEDEYSPCIVLLLNISQKLVDDSESAQRFVDAKLYRRVLSLLHTTDMGILQSSLEMLGRMADWSPLCRIELCESNTIDICLQLIPNGDLLTQKLCASLLRILACEDQAREQIRIYDGTAMLVSLLSVKNSRLQWHVAWTIAQLAENAETSQEVAQLGGISLILSELTDAKPSEKALNDWIAMITGMCALLAQLCQVDSNQQLIVNNNGIYLLGQVLLLHTVYDTLKNNSNWQASQCSLFRVLRLLFSLERNRHIFKKIFTPNFFEDFIDIGHYVQDLPAYRQLTIDYNIIVNETPLDELRSIWDKVNQRRDPLGKVAEYDLIEHLGSGAFGCVYTARKRLKDPNATAQYFALKEIYMIQTEDEMEKSFGDIISEVKIIKQQLRHPNIVRYRRIFVENNRLYIVMDLIEGASLKEHITSIKEKRQTFPEDRIWNITIQLILALRYLHKDKQIIHRDLKPNNIMIADKDRVVITDFGLAKQKGNDYLKSAAGTIIYSCPEVVQNMPYGEKADIWSFGCCVYEMAALRAAFFSQNMLALATQIVEGTYEKISETYSVHLHSLISHCLSPLSSDRPDILGVAELIAPRLLLCLDEITRIHASYQKSIKDINDIDLNASATRKSSSIGGSSSLNSSSNSYTGALAEPVKRKSAKTSKSILPNINNHINGNNSIDKPTKKSYSAGQSSSRHRSSLSFSSSLPRITQTQIQPQKRRITMVAVTEKRASSSSAVDIRKYKSTEGLSVRSAALRPISDPVLQILDQIHKIQLISQSGGSEKINHKKRCVEQFKKKLFAKGSNADMMKKHLRKLAVESPDDIELDLGFSDFRPVLANIHLPGYQIDEKVTRITYEQLSSCIQMLLKQTDIP